jgi:hypothetical protein
VNQRAIGTLAAALTAAVVLWPPAGVAVAPPDLEVVESTGIAAVQGVITRVPAESPGGAVYSETSVNLDKARGTAAGFTAGNLVEIFFGTSSQDYRNPTLVRSQYPPTSTAPAESAAESGQDGSSGSTMTATTKSTEQPSATAAATAKSMPGDVVSVTAGHSASGSFVDPDGTVSTQTSAAAGEVVIGGVVRFTDFASVATARVDATGQPLAETASTVGGVFVNGVPARLADDGLQIADQHVLGATQLAEFNAGLAQLREHGITIAGVRAEVVQQPGRARAASAVAVVRYQVPAGPIPNSIGNDEEFLVGQVVAESIAARRPPAAPLPLLSEPLPVAPGVAGAPAGGTGADVSPGPSPAPVRLDPPAPLPAGARGTAPGDTTGGPTTSGTTAVPVPVTATQPVSSAAGQGSIDEFALADAATVTPATRLRSGYSVFILAAIAGAVLFIAGSRARLA